MSAPHLSARRFGGDAAWLAAFVVLALVVGWAVNGQRAKPLEGVYRSPQERAHDALDRMGTSTVPAVAAEPRIIELDEFQAFVSEGRGLVIDARPELFFKLGHVPGAINLPRETFESDYPRRRNKLSAARAGEIALYCSEANCPDSSIVADLLGRLGYGRLLIYKEGWDEYSQTGMPIEKGDAP